MKYVIAGAGAIGAFIGAKMSLAGEDVTLYARGAHLAAMQQDGIRIVGEEGELHARPAVAATLEEIGPADVVFLCVKAHGLTALAPQLKPLLHENTVLVSTQNGIPWWYFQSASGELAGLHLDRVDPAGVIAANIEPHRVLGSLIYFSTDVERPGVIRHTEGNRLSLGEPDGGWPPALRAVVLRSAQATPIDGRPATMIRSPGCRPAVFSSRSRKPEGTPVTSDGLSRW